MPTRTNRVTRSEKLDLRLTATSKRMLQAAAKADRKSVSEFVLDSALARAEERLMDRQHFTLNAEQWVEFLKALDTPPREHPRLKRLLTEPSIFDGNKGR